MVLVGWMLLGGGGGGGFGGEACGAELQKVQAQLSSALSANAVLKDKLMAAGLGAGITGNPGGSWFSFPFGSSQPMEAPREQGLDTRLLERRAHSDVILTFDGQEETLHANRQVLAITSPELASLVGLSSENVGPTSSAISVSLPQGVTRESIQDLLKYAYKGELPHPAHARAVSSGYSTARRYGVEAIERHMSEMMEVMIRPETAAQLLLELYLDDEASLGPGERSAMQSRVMEYIVGHQEEVTQSRGFDAFSKYPELLMAVTRAVAQKHAGAAPAATSGWRL